ncbi:polysaccharide lyase family 7 protein [Akkermansiaceae bacterium]|nr:polysaccharide lyase family 7 protein [Akkermansiaceae bacterium]
MKKNKTHHQLALSDFFFLGKIGLMASSALLLAHSFTFAEAPSSLFPDITKFKLEFPLSDDGKDYRGVGYNDRSNPKIKNASVKELKGYEAPVPFNHYFFAEGKEMVFRAHCAGALTSPNAYPRCELRQQIKGKDTFWDYSNEHELNVTLKITHLPEKKQEVCVVQLKGTNTPETTSGTSEVLRVEYRQDGGDGWHLEVNESSGPKNVLKYQLGQSVNIHVHVNEDVVTLKMHNLDNGDTYSTTYKSEFSSGYFKAGAYTQSSIWSKKTKQEAEKPDAYSEVRFSKFNLKSDSTAPINP